MLNLHYEKIGEGNDKSLIILHGFMGCSEEYIKMAQELSEYFDCYLIDLPGHAKSTDQLTDYPSIQSIADAISNWAKTLPSPHLYGYSLGGRIAFAMTSMSFCPFIKVVVESAHPGLKSEEEKQQRLSKDSTLFKGINDQESFEIFLNNWYEQELFKHIKSAPSYESMLKRKIKNNNPTTLQAAINLFSLGKQANYWQKIANPLCSSLYICGEDDEKYSTIATQINRIGWNTVTIKDACHSTHFSNYQKFIDSFKKFMLA